jgi:hypothetical protein
MGHTWVIQPHRPPRAFRAVPRAADTTSRAVALAAWWCSSGIT